MPRRLTGVSIPLGWGASWETIKGDKDVARNVLVFLEDRRLLFGSRHWGQEDAFSCVRSALDIRQMLTEQITATKAGKTLEMHLRAMRAACRKFVDAAGYNAESFANPVKFGLALGDLRTAIALSIVAIVEKFDLPVEEELAFILPAEDDDATWLPGFGQRETDLNE